MVILVLRSPLWGRLLKNSRRVIPPLVVHRVLTAAWLRAPLCLLFGKTAEGVVPLVGRGELVLATVGVFALALLDRLGPKFPHHEAVLPGVTRRAIGRGVVRVRAFE